MKYIKKSILKEVYKKRKKWSKKNDFGRLLIIGGGNVYSGCVILNARAAISALRTGVDIVEVIAPKRCADIIACNSPDLITIPLKGEFIEKRHLKEIFKNTKNKSGFLIGGGIGKNKKTIKAVEEFLNKTKLRGVIDADAISAINKKTRLNNFIITPHEKEFFYLCGKRLDEDLDKRIKIVKEEAKKLNTVLLVKGEVDIISDGVKTALNKTGNSYMTKGGTGDTLAGIVASLVCQGNDLFLCACAGSYINGRAGELTKKKSSLIASDIVEYIGKIVDKNI